LTIEKIKKLKDQLNIEKEAYEKYQARAQEKKLIVSFRINPLTHDIEKMEKNKARRKKSMV
jgi:diaminopimelate decarboxylase